jgi:hypothetical protein
MFYYANDSLIDNYIRISEEHKLYVELTAQLSIELYNWKFPLNYV